MKTILRLPFLACLLLLLAVLASPAFAEEAAATGEPAAPTLQVEQALSANPAPEVLPFLQELDPLTGVQYAACTCNGRAAACATKCDICPDCYGDFTCNVADPCRSRCICRVANP